MDIYETISHNLMIIIGILMYICGLIGNIFNLIIFTHWIFSQKNVNNNSSLYLLSTSVSNLIAIVYPLLVRILVDGYGILVTRTNVFFLCKFRYYVLQTTIPVSLICTCMAAFDRYLITSRHVYLRQRSTKTSLTIKIICIIVSLCSLHSIPTAIYHSESKIGVCILNSDIYSYYYIYFVIVCLYGIFPICFISIFGTLTYQQLQTLHQNIISMDKQLSRMILFQCIAIVCSSIPYCIQEIYFSIFFKDQLPSSYILLFRIIAILLFYTNPMIQFYIFFLSTPNFRHQMKRILLRRNNQQHLRINQINITNV